MFMLPLKTFVEFRAAEGKRFDLVTSRWRYLQDCDKALTLGLHR